MSESSSLAHRSFALVALLLMLIFAASCGKKGDSGAAGGASDSTAAASDTTETSATEEGGDEEGGEGKQTRERAVTVNAAKVFRGQLVVPVLAEGTIRARRRADVTSEISARILHLYAEEGQSVRKGDKIAELDGREFSIAIEEAQARYLNALGAIAVEEDKIEGGAADDILEAKKRELLQREQRGEISRDERRALELDLGVEAMRGGAFRRELIEARTGLAQARADEERAQLNLSRTVIRAPFSGVISNLTITEGHHLSIGQTVCSLVDNLDVEADVGVLESELGGLEVGRPALLVLPALGETLRVHVDVINPEIDSASRTCRVLLRVKTEDGRVRPGMFVRAAIAGKIYENRLLVPNEAILTRDGRPLLFKVEDNQAKWVYVRLGLRNDQLSEIASVLQGGPLEEGTLVVVSDHLTLSHDAKVKVRRVVDAQVAWTQPQDGEAEN